MDDAAAIELYNRAGDAARSPLGAVHWPHLALTAANLVRLVEGVLEDRCHLVRLAFGDAFDPSTVAERLSAAWRTDAFDARYAPEGVFVRATLSVLLEIAPEDAGDPDEEAVCETLACTVELCVSFTERHHTRPFIDVMGGQVLRMTDGAVAGIDPLAHEVSPADAVSWGLNGV